MKSKELKRKEALLRAMQYNQLPIPERIKKAMNARGESRRQIAKLKKMQEQQ